MGINSVIVIVVHVDRDVDEMSRWSAGGERRSRRPASISLLAPAAALSRH